MFVVGNWLSSHKPLYRIFLLHFLYLLPHIFQHIKVMSFFFALHIFFVTVMYALIWSIYCVFLYYLATNSVSNRFVELCMDLMTVQ